MTTPRVIVLEGGPAQIGIRHGRLLGTEIRSLLRQMDMFIFRRVGLVRGVGLRVVTRALALAMDRYIPAHLREEMKGIARGSGVAYGDILVLNSLDDVLNVLRRLAPRSPSLACSSFAVCGDRTADGQLIHGRNLDYHFRNTPLDDGGAVARLLQQRALLFVVRPQGRAGFVALGWPGMTGIVTALNQEGLSLGNLTSYVRGTTPNGKPTAILYRQIMEEASTLGHTAGLLRGSRRTIGNNLMVGSGREDSASLFEIVPDAVFEVAPREGLLVSTNHFLTPSLASRQRPYLIPHSVARWNRLRSLVDGREISTQDGLSFLADVACEEGGREGNPFARIANEGTAVSVMFRPAEMEMWIGVNDGPPASAGRFLPVNAKALLARPAGYESSVLGPES